MLRDWLTLKDVQIARKTEVSDGMGGMSVTTTHTTLPRAIIWSPGQSQRYVSDKMARASTHVLITDPSDYTFTDQDFEVIHGGKTYRITGPSDDVMELGEITQTGLERLS